MLKRTSEYWYNQIPKEHNLIIMDPDGWDRTNYVYSFEVEEITKEEFDKRLSYSTISCKTSFFETI